MYIKKEWIWENLKNIFNIFFKILNNSFLFFIKYNINTIT